ncbi:MAG: hypothetical protein QXT48_02115 [Thermoplasmatales archaeon]
MSKYGNHELRFAYGLVLVMFLVMAGNYHYPYYLFFIPWIAYEVYFSIRQGVSISLLLVSMCLSSLSLSVYFLVRQFSPFWLVPFLVYLAWGLYLNYRSL